MKNIQKSFDSLFSSEKQRLQVLKSKFSWLFYLGICIMLAFSSLLMIMLYPLHKGLNIIWTKFYSEAKKNSLNIRYALNNRVSKYHDMDENFYPQESEIHAHNLTFPHIKHYTFQLGFLIIFGFVLYYISIFIFCAKIQQHLIFKIEFSESMLNRRVYLFQRGFFLNEIFADYKNIGFCSLYGFSPLPPSEIGYTYMSKKTSNSRKDIFQSYLQDVMQSNVWETTFATIKGHNDFLRYGFNSGLFDIRQESWFLMTNYENCEFKCFLKVNNNYKDLMIFFNETWNDADDSSKIYLKKASQEFLLYLHISIGFILAVILCCTLPYFSKEQKIVKHLKINECDRSTSIFSEERNQAKLVSFEVPSKFPDSTKNLNRIV
ncbi:hypothetical protein SteCoe_546 [Stentor coeruleus]|uniref:Uncharacterized protein n=1 Tax=Stentor coeruleus TaxID=5963 RepID=A0A1R2D419_9CILI|nr:hypothetical protein SteCoe_546 [Stentor coeruleus]